MSVIFLASTDTFSSHHTSRFIGPFLRWLDPSVSAETVENVQYVVRKAAHLTEYAILSLFVWRAVRGGLKRSLVGWSTADAAKTLVVCFFYAISDEFHQSFVPSRYASPVDVMIDTAGSAMALFLLSLFLRRRTLHE